MDLVPLLSRQMLETDWKHLKLSILEGIQNLSLKELSSWCEDRFGQNEVLSSHDNRPMDAPWIVLDSTTAQNVWDWSVKTKIEKILEEIANHSEKNPEWSKLC